MIVSASRRTDIPALYSPWLKGRLDAGFVDVVHPFDANRVRRVDLRPSPNGEMEAMVLWTRNPSPLLSVLEDWEARTVRSLWLVTVTGYPRELERDGPRVETTIAAIRTLADVIGPDRVVWRYDPILLCPPAGLSVDWHCRNFDVLARAVRGATRRCVVSFYDDYAKARKRLAADGLTPLPKTEALFFQKDLMAELKNISKKNEISLQSCCEDLAQYGVSAGACVDGELLEELWGLTYRDRRDPGQREGCRCARSVDIGAYDTCTHGCLYCYATGTLERAKARRATHDPAHERLS